LAHRPVESFTGRAMCERCAERTRGLAAGILACPGGADVGRAIAVEGWYQRFRARRRARG
jgi:hypothetical protein